MDDYLTDREDAMVRAIVEAIRNDKYLDGVWNEETAFAVMFVSAMRAIIKFRAENP